MSGKKITHKTIAKRNGGGRTDCRASPARSLAMLAAAGLVSCVSLPAMAQQANRVFANCTFTTATLQSILNIPLSGFVNNQLQASYIVIYTRTNPNDGQPLKSPAGTFSGPILCVNATANAAEIAVPTTENTPIPNATNQPGTTSVDILGAEEAFHLQYRRNPGGVIEKRVCHTVAGITDCFFIQPK
jgi:hypothetical protein